MNRTERFYKIQELLRQRRVVPRDLFLEVLEVSLATFKRDLEYLRDRFSMPIIYDREANGYRLDQSDPGHVNYELPGLWFSASELHALMTMEYLLRRLQPGLMGGHVAPLRARIRKLLESGDHSAEEVERRIRVLRMGAREVEPAHFQTITTALLSRRRLVIDHFKRSTGDTSERIVSPQRLVHYRDNWYLDAWCHLRKGLRTFSVDAIHSAHIRDQAARDIDDADLDEVLTPGFGIFSGRRVEKAVLRFEAQRARWVSREFWHEEQEGEFELDGSYVLKVPYSDPRELVMDILKFGPDVEVLGPAPLRELVAEKARLAAARYPTGEPT